MSVCAIPETGNTIDEEDVAQMPLSSSSRNMLKGQGVTDRAVQALRQLSLMDVPELYNLVHSWLDKEVNLPLAEPFVARCAAATKTLWNLVPNSNESQELDAWLSQYARLLLKNTRGRIILSKDSTCEDYFSQMFEDNLRWESLGIFFSAASRAAIDTKVFPSLFTHKQQKQDLVRALTFLVDCCLDASLSLDCLNDLQLILQYENFIIHSQVDGDQSEQYYRSYTDH